MVELTALSSRSGKAIANHTGLQRGF